MKFITHTILNPVSSTKTLKDIAAEVLKTEKKAEAEQVVTKEASEAKPGLGLTDKDPRGANRGQVINNDNEPNAHSYQEGESVKGKPEQGGNARPDTGGTTDQKDHKQKDKEASNKQTKVVKAHCGKEMGESNKAGDVTEEHSEAAPGDDNNKDCKQLINNDPNYQKGESTKPGNLGKGKKTTYDNVVSKKSESTSKFKKVSSLNRMEKIALMGALAANKHNPLVYVEAMVGEKFANLTDEEKEYLRKYWSILYPPKYADDMVEDR